MLAATDLVLRANCLSTSSLLFKQKRKILAGYWNMSWNNKKERRVGPENLEGTLLSFLWLGGYYLTLLPVPRLDSYVTLDKVLKLSHLNFLTCKKGNDEHIYLMGL